MPTSSPSSRTLLIEGMSCASCSARVEKALKAVPGVTDAHVNLATQQAQITGTASQEALIGAVKTVGFGAAPLIQQEAHRTVQDRKTHREAQTRALRHDLLHAVILWLLILFMSMGHGFGFIPVGWRPWLQWVFATLALIGPGRQFYRAGLPALLHRTPTMNTLVALGTGAAYLYSSLVVFASALLPAETQHLYFDTILGIITLVLLGRLLEARAKGRTSAALEKLICLQPQEAHRLHNGGGHDVPIAQIKPGDQLLIRPGERVPLDGVILEGKSHLDESMLTGEALPTPRGVGETIIGGTLNQEGALTIQATATGADTVLARIISMVEHAQGSKLPIQSLVDKVILWFVPVIIAIAGLTFLLWLIIGPAPSFIYALTNAIAVLIAACPCAMGLATPTAIMVATGKGAEIGILFRKGEALQSLGHTRLVAFDKTGTLTKGQPHLTDIYRLDDTITEEALLALAAAVERHSDHPLARAITQAAEERAVTLPPVRYVSTLTGLGIEAQDEAGHHIHLGNHAYMKSLGHYSAEANRLADTLSQKGTSPLYMTYKGRIIALMAIADPIRPSAAAAIAALKNAHIRTVMITGDIEATARSIAQQAGIEDVIAHVMPEEKGATIQTLQKLHGPVAFVGDGINDAPALALADTGLAISHGTDIAIEAADLVLTRDSLMSVPDAITLSRSTMKVIRQNLFWAFIYNIVLIPLAAGALYPLAHIMLSPAFAAGAMAFSSLFVLGNAIRLRFAPPFLPEQAHKSKRKTFEKGPL
ncbi:heavy metal translocating P-type ATPase [Bombella pollinis]|uniref:Heavy metal translocating P-type ATPase n=1 Tax=Bombella pollinis TaxID=2967337 RepID=A0ABT3WIK3_9PROT|nr:heavy metal translocating P-type ATPase [Bombella pollinis]MCX5618927.1 heavy metal translocating P-type ATPase [Bombella pollinis]